MSNFENETVEFEESPVCQYCGQINLTGDVCNCYGAQKAQRIAEQIKNAHQAIEEIFSDEDENGNLYVGEETINILKTIAEQIAHHKIHSAAFVLPHGTRAKLSRSAKGTIKVERTKTEKEAAEVEE